MRPFVQATNEGQSTGCMATTAGFSFASTSFLHFVYAASRTSPHPTSEASTQQKYRRSKHS